jgi:hypothetical protein
MDEREKESRGLWSFTEGMLGPDDSVKDFRVEASDGHAGRVSWASYAPARVTSSSASFIASTRRITSCPPAPPRESAPRIARYGCALAEPKSRNYLSIMISIMINQRRSRPGWLMP